YKCTSKDIENPEKVLKEIFENLRLAYMKAKIINCDISEYNIMFDGSTPWIIDWPQYVPVSHLNAKELIMRDIYNPALFFKKKFRLKVEIESAVAFVIGERRELKISQT
ncbi:MAG: RIO1 family regulatory kinase/ATPase, partial [Rhabdochlamydiaceae bacterium]